MNQQLMDQVTMMTTRLEHMEQQLEASSGAHTNHMWTPLQNKRTQPHRPQVAQQNKNTTTQTSGGRVGVDSQFQPQHMVCSTAIEETIPSNEQLMDQVTIMTTRLEHMEQQLKASGVAFRHPVITTQQSQSIREGGFQVLNNTNHMWTP